MMKRILSILAIAIVVCTMRAYGQVTVTYNPESGSVLSELPGFEATFSCEMQLDSNGGFVYRGGILLQTQITATILEDKHTVRFTINPTLTAPGEYTFKYMDWLVKPAKSSDGPIPTIAPVYTVSAMDAIKSVSVENVATDKVYNLQGIEVKGEPKGGIFIINGKKVVK